MDARILRAAEWAARRAVARTARLFPFLPYDDRYQIAWVAMLASSPHGGPGTPAYLYRRALGGILDAARRNSPLPRTRREIELVFLSLSTFDPPSPTPGPEEIVAQRELSPRSAAALAELAPRQAWLVRGVVLEGRDLQDVAPEVGLSISRASVVLRRTLRQLEQSLRRAGGPKTQVSQRTTCNSSRSFNPKVPGSSPGRPTA